MAGDLSVSEIVKEKHPVTLGWVNSNSKATSLKI